MNYFLGEPGKRSIRPIPTEYNGIKFRSKLEAKWAEYLDSKGVEWLYEEEGYDLNGVWYLPDFFLPKQFAFLEVKGLLDDRSKDKCQRLADAITTYHLKVYLGTPEMEMILVESSEEQLRSRYEHRVHCLGLRIESLEEENEQLKNKLANLSEFIELQSFIKSKRRKEEKLSRDFRLSQAHL